MLKTPYHLTIDGKQVHAADAAQAVNPATEQPICNYPLATRAQLDAAVASAQTAFRAWSGTALAERQQMVAKLGDLIEQHRPAFVELLITEQGKGRAAAEWEIGGSAFCCREIAKQSLQDEVVSRHGDEEIVTRHTPIGVIGAITPWNFPLLLAVWKIAPALVAGNTVVLKPSPFTPLCTLWFGELAQTVLPPGVLSVLSGGNELGQWMTEHPGMGKISFEQAEAIARRIEAGTVWINQVHVLAPGIAFGGHKQSGVGIENSLQGLSEYCNLQTVMRKALQ